MTANLVEIVVEDGTIVNLATSANDERANSSKKWIAVVTRDMSKPGTLERDFLDSIDKVNRGLRCKLPKKLAAGAFLEMAVKVHLRSGTRTKQLLFKVEDVHPERLIVTAISLADVSKTSTSAIKTPDEVAASGVQIAHLLISQLKDELKHSRIALAAALAAPALLEASRANTRTLVNRISKRLNKLSPDLKENEILTKVFADVLLLRDEVRSLDASPEPEGLSCDSQQE